MSKLHYLLVAIILISFSSCAFLWEFFWNDIVFYGSCDCRVTKFEYAYVDSTMTWEWVDVEKWTGYAVRSEKAEEVRKECEEWAVFYSDHTSDAFCECD